MREKLVRVLSGCLNKDFTLFESNIGEIVEERFSKKLQNMVSVIQEHMFAKDGPLFEGNCGKKKCKCEKPGSCEKCEEPEE